MTTKSETETAKTDNGTPPETGKTADTETNGKPAETEGNTDTGSESTEEDGRLKVLRKSLDEKTKRLAELEEAEAERQRAEMSETEKLKADLEARDKQLADMETAALRSTIASKHGLSAELAERLKGNTAEELEQDATSLAELVKPRTTSATDAGIGGKSGNVPTDPREIHRQWAGR